MMEYEIDQEVHYVIPVGGAHCRARIVNVVHHGEGVVTLFVIPEHEDPPYFFTWNAEYSPECKPGTWHYIEDHKKKKRAKKAA